MSLKQRRFMKKCPTLDYQLATKQIQYSNFDFTEEFYEKFQNFMMENPGKTAKELCYLIKFYKFNPKTLTFALKMFNTYKNTYHNVCGPFIYKHNKWYPVYGEKYTDTVIISQKNKDLCLQIKKLRLQIELLNKIQ